jgi:hypothetical protein
MEGTWQASWQAYMSIGGSYNLRLHTERRGETTSVGHGNLNQHTRQRARSSSSLMNHIIQEMKIRGPETFRPVYYVITRISNALYE